MRKRLIGCAVFGLLATGSCFGQQAVIKLDAPTLMHEVRATPSPLDGEHVFMNPPRFMWPDKYPHLGEVLDGVAGPHEKKPAVTYRVRISQDRNFRDNVISGEKPWAFFNPFQTLAPGQWYWQHAYVAPDGTEEWSPVHTFFVDADVLEFNPPSLDKVLSAYPAHHPRVLLDADDWDRVIAKNRDNPEAMAYMKKADKCLSRPLRHLSEEIDTSHVVKLTNKVQRKSSLIREGRKIVDREEANVETLVRAYLLTRDEKYARECMKRLTEILSWRANKYFAGDFNMSTLLSMSTSAYDGLYDTLTDDERKLLLTSIRQIGDKFYRSYVNHLENRIADNHVWQMTFRILTMAAFATVGEIPEASVWADYCYNEWVSRFPGLNDDGAWHNGDSYFHVNIRTLVEVPAFYSRISGFDFFADPWYDNNVKYVIYQQPPFSMTGGHGNAHENNRTPTGGRVGYADAISRECNNPWARAYVYEIMQEDPVIFSRAFENKPGDLTWYRCTTTKERPAYTKTLADMPPCKVFGQNGTAVMTTDLGHHDRNAMLTFRSSPYGATSHALSNQNAFNTFFGGKPIFYSSGYRTGFTDDHCMYAYRNTRAHNSILVNGKVQRIGTEGYGWVPRYYEGEEISYVVGDASNAYGKVVSPLWLTRGEVSGTHYTPRMGWDENKVSMFRRHIVQLGRSGLFVIYDELEGTEDVNWNYMLHTVEKPMDVSESKDGLRIKGSNTAGGVSVAHLYSPAGMSYEQVDTFFVPPVDWLKKRGNKKFTNHYHFTATTVPVRSTCFLNVIDVHGTERGDMAVKRKGNRIEVDGWVIQCNLDGKGTPRLRIDNKDKGVALDFNYGDNQGATTIVDRVDGTRVEKRVVDKVPRLEI